jgi:hypothetical protein
MHLKRIQIKRPYNVENTSNNNWKGQSFINKKGTQELHQLLIKTPLVPPSEFEHFKYI